MKYFIIFLILIVFPGTFYPQHFTPPDSLGYTLIEDTGGGAIYSKKYNSTISLVLQVIDLRKSRLDIITGNIIRTGNDGIHCPLSHANPWFVKMNFDSAFNKYKKVYGSSVISFTNTAFFETIRDSANTPLAYPLKLNGKIVSAGASPYAPNTGNFPLKILTIEDSSILIEDYNYETGEPLNDKTKPNQLATLNYRHHPRVILFPEIKGGKKARFHLITAIDEYGNPEKETVLILSSTNELSIYELAGELKKLSNKIIDDDILTLDGGSSISVQDKNGNDIIKPLNNVKVPVYFGFRLKNKIQQK